MLTANYVIYNYNNLLKKNSMQSNCQFTVDMVLNINAFILTETTNALGSVSSIKMKKTHHDSTLYYITTLI